MQVPIFWIISVFGLHSCVSLRVPPDWEPYLTKVIENFLKSPVCVVVPPPPPHSIISLSDNIAAYCLPPVLVWDPYVSIPSLPLHCIECDSPVVRKKWKLGQSRALEPRSLHDITSIVVLISSQYVCANNHIFLTTDPRVLERVLPDYIPFILLHRTGFLKSFVSQVIGLVEEGLSFMAVERFILKQRKLTAARISAELRATSKFNDEQCRSPSLIEVPYPSNDILCKCFLAEFILNRNRYTATMARIRAKHTISLDHTFKIAANIGYLRDDGKWVTQYECVFIVMNEDGLVMTWQFARSTAIDEVKKLLRGVQERVDILKDQNLLIMVDNCCNIKGILCEVFGENIKVKLDLFDATQRINKKVSKRHPLFTLCMADLRLVFRQPMDLGHHRTRDTPYSLAILANLEHFARKWIPCEVGGWKLINDKVLNEIKSLNVHITRGCLSNIPVGAGTNRNERLHRHLKPHFSRTRLGLPMALSLMTILLWIYNSRLLQKKPKSPNIFAMDQNVFDRASQMLTLNEISSNIITLEETMNIIEKAIHQFNVTKVMDKKSIPSMLNYQFFPFMSSVSTLFFSSLGTDFSSTQLDSLIAAWKMKRQAVSKDGNCCFSSVAIGLRLLHTAMGSALKLLNPQLNFDCVQTLSQQLRHIAVEEWKANAEDYKIYVVDDDVCAEAVKFYQQGHFSSDLGDSLLVSLANGLGVQFIVFTTMEYHPVVHVTPRVIKCALPIYLAYTHTGCGHYDAVVSMDNELPRESEQAACCSCGKNKSKTGSEEKSLNCVPIQSKYTTTVRCRCLKDGKTCTSLCRCSSCGNGKEQYKSKPSRKRQRHAFQLGSTKSSVFGVREGEDLHVGTRSVLEFFVLEGVLEFLKEHSDEAANAKNILIIYSTIVDIANSFEQKLPIEPKNIDHVRTFLREHQHNLDKFNALCCAQLQLCIKSSS